VKIGEGRSHYYHQIFR